MIRRFFVVVVCFGFRVLHVCFGGEGSTMYQIFVGFLRGVSLNLELLVQQVQEPPVCLPSSRTAAGSAVPSCYVGAAQIRSSVLPGEHCTVSLAL